MDLETIKRVLFEVYSAGYEQGYVQNEDIATAYEKWWKSIMEGLYDWKRSDIYPS